MNARGRIFFRLIAGAYLAYIGLGLARDAFADKPEHYVLFGIGGIIFILIGLFFVVGSIQQYKNMPEEEYYDDEDDETEVADETDDNDEAVVEKSENNGDKGE